MSEINTDQELKTIQRKKLGRKLEAMSWGLFFVWMGIAVLAGLGWGVGFLGIGVIILARLAVCEYLSASVCSGRTKASC
jgi:hypothetical protein